MRITISNLSLFSDSSWLVRLDESAINRDTSASIRFPRDLL